MLFKLIEKFTYRNLRLMAFLSQELIKILLELCESKNVTQVELARRLNKPQSYVSKVEILERRLDVIELIDWLSAIDEKLPNFIKSYLI
jgi:transcriptional regulator with XRE-family HTH domain